MATMLIEPDPFPLGVSKKLQAFKPALHVDPKTQGDIDSEKFHASQREQLSTTLDQVETVSRPVYGTLAKPNTHAYVQVIDYEGSVIQCFNNIGISGKKGYENFGYYLADKKAKEKAGLFDAGKAELKKLGSIFSSEVKKERKFIPDQDGSPKANVWTDWILQSVQEQRVEKTQVIETFGDSYLYAFGQRPRSISFSGLLLNTTDHNWRSIFWQNWDEHFRATKLVEKNARVYLQWDEIIIEGYPINAVCSEVADSPNAMKFSFNLFVTNYINIAAQSGFLTQQYMRVAQLRQGSGMGMISKTQGYRMLGGESFSPTNFNYEQDGMFGMEGKLGLRTGKGAQYEKFSLVGQLGPALGNSIMRGFLNGFGNEAVAEGAQEAMQTNTGRALLRQLGYAVNAAQKAIQLTARGDEHQLQIFGNHYLRQLGQDVLSSLATDVTNLAEDYANVRRGEINQIIGYVASFISEAKGKTTEGSKFELSPHAKYSSVQRMATSWINPGGWGGTYTVKDANGNNITRGWGQMAGGITQLAGDGTPINEVILSLESTEIIEEPDS